MQKILLYLLLLLTPLNLSAAQQTIDTSETWGTIVGKINSNSIDVTNNKATLINTIADLRNTPVVLNTIYQVKGYYTPGDGGGGPERIGVTGAAAGTYVDDGGSIIVPTGGDGSAAWVIPAGTRLNVLWFGADRTGVTSSVAAFTAAFAKDNCPIIPAGTFDISGLTLTGTHTYPKVVEGAGIGATILTGASDLITSAGYIYLKKLSIYNTATRGKLLSFTGVAVNTSVFEEVFFGMSAYHIYAPMHVVGWRFKKCIFRDASIISRHLYYTWATQEEDCYSWYNDGVSLEINGGTNFTSTNCVYEKNNNIAIRLVNSNYSPELNVFNFNGLYLEDNGATADQPHVYIETNTSSNARIGSISFDGLSIFNHTHTKTVPNIVLNRVNGAIGRISIDNFRCFNGELITNSSLAYIYIGTGAFATGLVAPLNAYSIASDKIITGALAGNSYEQYPNTITAGTVHFITISTVATGTGTGGAMQQHVVTKKPDGTLSTYKVFESRTGIYGCDIDIITPSVGDYSIRNTTSMSSNFQPRIIIEQR
jgi:hypothetical protein